MEKCLREYAPIYGSNVFVYNINHEDAPFLDCPEVSPGSPSFVANAESQAQDLSKQANTYYLTHYKNYDKPASNPKTTWQPSCTVILQLSATADTVVYTLIQHLIRTAELDDEIEDPSFKLIESVKKIDFFSRNLPDWLQYISDFRSECTEIYEKFGFNKKNKKRLLWVRIFEKLRNRFVHRSPYFLEIDFIQMRQVATSCKDELSSEITKSSTKDQVFSWFILHVANKIVEFAKFRITPDM